MILYEHKSGRMFSESSAKKRYADKIQAAIARGLIRVAYTSNVTVKRVERERQAYCGLELHNGEYFGKDSQGPFAWKLIAENDNAIKLLRFSASRGWYPNWEENSTTKAIILVAMADDVWKYRRFESNLDGCPSAPIMRIHNESNVSHMGSYLGKPRFSASVGFSFGKEVRIVGTPDLVGMEAKDGSKYTNIYNKVVQPIAMGF